MTRRTNARLAGFMFLIYIATGVADMVLFGQATSGAEGTAATLASIAQHATLVRLTAVLTLFCAAYAVVLGVTLYALTRDQDAELAVIALCCRVSEGVIGAMASVAKLQLLSVATASTTAAAPDAAAVQALGALLLKGGSGYYLVSATLFAIGSTLFSYLFLRARTVPVPLAWLGLLASVLLVAGLTLQLAGFLRGPAANVMWIPIAVFEVVFALWLIIKGVAAPAERIASR